MPRKLGQAVLATLLLSAPCAAQGRGPDQAADPRECLFDRMAEPQRTEMLRAARMVELGPPEQKSASMNRMGALLYPQVDRCMASGGWRPSQRFDIQFLGKYEAAARGIEGDLVALGIDPKQLRQFVRTLPIDRLVPFQIGVNNYLPARVPKGLEAEVERTNAELLRPFEQRTGRKLNPAEQHVFWRALYFRLLVQIKLNAIYITNNLDRLPYLVEQEQLIPALRATLPRIMPRTLDQADRARLKQIAKEYRSGPTGQTAPRLNALIEIAQSGDREAMLALRDLLLLGPPTDLLAHYGSLGLDTSQLYVLPKRMAAQWTAQLWTLHGYEEPGRRIVNECVGGLYGAVGQDKANGVTVLMGAGGALIPVNANGEEMGTSWSICGFDLIAKSAYRRDGSKFVRIAAPGERILAWYNKGYTRSQIADFVITGARFDTAGNADTEARFQAYLLARSRGDYLNASGQSKLLTANAELERAFYTQYARDSGRSGLIEMAEAGKRAELQALFAEGERRRQATWEAAVSRYRSGPASPAAQDALRDVASSLGLDYYSKFRAIVPEQKVNPGGAAQTISGFASTQVDVRTYDSAGNYQGATRTSSVWADIMKVTSAAPR